jgi:hypothetical protein
MSSENKSVYGTLSSISVKDKIERKGNLDYLSWANAWAILKTNYPSAQRIVYESSEGMNYFTDGVTAWVKVGINVNGIEHIDYLPVMDFKNNSIPLAKLTSIDVTKAIQRSTAKAIAMHGLGLSLWTGEDVPEVTTEVKKPVQQEQADLIELKKGTANWDAVVKYVTDNKAIGIEAIGKQLIRKYKISPALKKEIAELCKP